MENGNSLVQESRRLAQLFLDGSNYDQLADQTGMSQRTVRDYVSIGIMPDRILDRVAQHPNWGIKTLRDLSRLRLLNGLPTSPSKRFNIRQSRKRFSYQEVDLAITMLEEGKITTGQLADYIHKRRKEIRSTHAKRNGHDADGLPNNPAHLKRMLKEALSSIEELKKNQVAVQRTAKKTLNTLKGNLADQALLFELLAQDYLYLLSDHEIEQILKDIARQSELFSQFYSVFDHRFNEIATQGETNVQEAGSSY